MCIYDSPSESYAAFKKIWPIVYGNRMPTQQDAIRYSGDENPNGWYKNVTKFYNSY